MDLSTLSEEENKALQKFSAYYEEENYAEALSFAQEALEKHPSSAYIWHNQVGALIYSEEEDYQLASEHYYAALEKGFPSDVCEDNIWESAEEFQQSLKAADGSYNAILFRSSNEEEEVRFKSVRANALVLKYLEHFPNGRYSTQANTLLKEFDEVTSDK